jgi:hypothetical protein
MTIHDELSKLYGGFVRPVQLIREITKKRTPEAPNKVDSIHIDHDEETNLKCEHVPEKRLKTWKDRSSEQKLKDRYLNPMYVYKLLHLDVLEEYDGGARKICHSNCPHNCKAKFKYDANGLQNELKKWWGDDSGNNTRTAMLMEDLKDWSVKSEGGPEEVRWFILNRQVCRNFYLRARGMTHETVRKLTKQLFEDNCAFLSVLGDTHESKELKRSPKRDEIVAWLSLFANHVGDKLPDEDITVLPYRSLSGVYDEYVEDLNSESGGTLKAPAKPAYFYRVFANESAGLKIRLQRNTGTFVTCKLCDAYATNIRAARTVQHRLKLKEYRRKHLNKQRGQRDKYYKQRRKGSTLPKQYLSIIIYGMDQQKTNIPIMASKIKDESPLEQRIIGVKVHGHRNYLFVVDQNLPGGANLMVEVLRKVLLDLEQKGELPCAKPVLYVQVDNCGENKNKYFFGFLTHLVKIKSFSKIKVGFLMVGHTHEDIDQMFSIISSYLKKESVICPDQASFFQAICDAFKDENLKPEVISLTALDVHDYVAFYDQYIDTHIHHYQEPHQFRIKEFTDSSGETVVLLHYKSWCTSSIWLPTSQPRPLVNHPIVISNPANNKPLKKKVRGKLTLGQKMAMERSKLSNNSDSKMAIQF